MMPRIITVRLKMRHMTHDANVYFRAPSRIITEAEQVARDRGMSFSEFLRHAVRSELKREAAR